MKKKDISCKICSPLGEGNGYCANHSTSGMAYKVTGNKTLEELLDFLPAGFEKNKVGNEKYRLTIIKTPKHLIGFMDNKEWQVSYSTYDGSDVLVFIEENELRVALEKMISYLNLNDSLFP